MSPAGVQCRDGEIAGESSGLMKRKGGMKDPLPEFVPPVPPAIQDDPDHGNDRDDHDDCDVHKGPGYPAGHRADYGGEWVFADFLLEGIGVIQRILTFIQASEAFTIAWVYCPWLL